MISNIGAGGHHGAQMAALRPNRFKKADADRDGKVTKEELSSVLPKNGKGSTVDDIFAKADTNQDGAIDQAEEKAALEHAHDHRPPGLARAAENIAKKIFASADTDSSGAISQDELTAGLSKHETRINSEDLFKLMDTDSNGSVTQTELTDLLKKFFYSKVGATYEPQPPTATDQPDPATPPTYSDSGEATIPPIDPSFTAVA